MSFEEIYYKFFAVITKYCYTKNGGDSFAAEEAASKTFHDLHKKWSKLPSHDEIYIKSWLIGAAKIAVKEVKRATPPSHEPFHEPWCQDLIEKQQINDHYAPEEEEQKLAQYIEEIEAQLNPQDRPLFHSIVAEQLPTQVIAAKLNISENAVQIRWTRLKKKLRPLVESIFQQNY